MKNNFLKITRLLYVAILFTGLIACSPGKKVADKATANERLTDALLWKIEGEGIEQPSYIFGTIHLISQDEFFYPSGVLAAVDESDRITFEIDINDMMDISKQLGVMQKAFMKDNTSLKDLLSDDDYLLVKQHFDKMGIPLFFLERMQPMFLTVFGYGDMQPGDLQSGEMVSYELKLNELAKQQDKETAGLETIDYQLSAVDSIPYKEQADMLVQTIKNSDEGKDELEAMMSMYKEQRIDDMYTEIGEEGGSSADFEKILLTNRNKNWIPIMEDMVREKPTLFAVGAGHLGGPNGMIRLLMAKGYELTPVSQTDK